MSILCRFTATVFLVTLGVSAVPADEPAAPADEQVFSGPQAQEPMPELTMTGVFDDLAGKPVNVTEQIGDGPSLVIFVHERTRPTFGLMNALLRFSETRRDKGLTTAVCLLSADPTDTENWLKQVRGYLPKSDAPLIGISPDGLEGPGAFGLNRNVAMTILVSDKRTVAANFALVQPGLDVDGPKILKAVVEITGGGDVPAISDFAGVGSMRREAAAGRGDRPKSSEPDERLRPLLVKVIRLDATDEEVDAAAADVVTFVTEHPELKPQIAAIANRIIDAGKLENYGTPRAQKYLTDWSTEFADKQD